MLKLDDFKSEKVDNLSKLSGGYINTVGGDGCVNGKCGTWTSDRVYNDGSAIFYGWKDDVGSCD